MSVRLHLNISSVFYFGSLLQTDHFRHPDVEVTQEFCEVDRHETTAFRKGLCNQAVLNSQQLLHVCSKVRYQGKVKGENQNSQRLSFRIKNVGRDSYRFVIIISRHYYLTNT